VTEVSEKPGTEWVGTPLDAVEVDPRGIAEITVEFDEGEVLTPKINDRFGSYDLNEAARYIFFLSNHISKRGIG
jgi:hypothetical protein